MSNFISFIDIQSYFYFILIRNNQSYVNESDTKKAEGKWKTIKSITHSHDINTYARKENVWTVPRTDTMWWAVVMIPTIISDV